MIDNNLCSFCESEKETLIHLFFSCEIVQALWKEVSRFIQSEFKLNIVLNAETVMWNNAMGKPKHIVNLVILIAKQYIYRQRCRKKMLHMPEIKAKVLETKCTEKYIAIKNNCLEKHLLKWTQTEEQEVDGNMSVYIQRYLANITSL